MNDDRTRRIRATLIRDWDPPEVGDNPHLSDEYDRYIPGILRLIESRCSVEQLTDHLGRMESEEMGLEPSPGETRRAAQAVLASWAASS
jgi:hypothetical protein